MDNCHDLYAEFRSPGNRYRMAPIFRFNDEADAARIDWQVRSLKEKGWGGVFLYLECLGGGAPFRFLSEGWWRVVELTAAACAREGLDFWMYDDEDWPSGIIAGRLVREHPELGWKYLYPEERAVRGPETVRMEIGPHPLVAAVAFRMDGENIVEDSIVDLTPRAGGAGGPGGGGPSDAGGKAPGGVIEWHAPPGEWRLAIYTMRPGVGGFMCGASADLMDPAAGEAFVEMSYRPHVEHVARVPGAKLMGFFTDEPTCSMALYSGWPRWADKVPPEALPWTPRFLEAFRAQHGYDARSRLPLMHHRSGFEWVRFRAHYFGTCSRLMREAYFAPIHRFCRERGLVATGHLNGEESFHHHLAACGGDLMTHYRHMDVPGIDWIVPFSIPLPAVAPKFAASAAHRQGCRQVMCESFAASGWCMSFQEMRSVVNWENVNGISLQVPISYRHSLRGPERTTFYPPGISYQQPYWDHFRAFADYEARLCALAAGGGHVAQVALYYPACDFAAHYNDKPRLEGLSKAFCELGDAIRHAGYDFDIVDDEAILELAKIDSARLIVGEEYFQAVILPPMETVRRAMVEKLLEIASSGVTVILTGAVPLRVPPRVPRHSVESGCDDPKLARLLTELLGQGGRPNLEWTESYWHPCAQHGRAGYAPYVNTAVDLLLTAIPPDLQVAPPAEGVVALHRRLEDGDLYMLLNHTDMAQDADLTLSVKGYPERWDPLTGGVEGIADCQVTPEGTRMRLRFAPQELIPVFLHADPARAAKHRPERFIGEVPLPGPFRFRIEETMKRPEVAWNFTQAADGWRRADGRQGVPASPAAPKTIELGDWRGKGLRFFSGIGHYSTVVDLGDLPAGARVELDLGRVAVSAEAFVNEASAGIAIFEPFVIDLTRLARPGRNTLRIAVANTLSNYYSQFEELAKADLGGGGDLPHRRTSGLLGPVCIRIYRRE